jgi:hypothetical protein
LYVTRAAIDASVRCCVAGISETLYFPNESWEMGQSNYSGQGDALEGQWLVLAVWKTYIVAWAGSKCSYHHQSRRFDFIVINSCISILYSGRPSSEFGSKVGFNGQLKMIYSPDNLTDNIDIFGSFPQMGVSKLLCLC